MANRECVIFLYEEIGLGRRKLDRLIKLNHDVLSEAITHRHPSVLTILTVKECKNISSKIKQGFNAFVEALASRRYKTWTILDEDYPYVFRTIPDPPVVLYGLGQAHLVHQANRLSVIGSREPTLHTEKRMQHLLLPILKDFVIVSGMAKGIDGLAHQLAVKGGGRTIAVIGSGFQYPYPYENKALFAELFHHHLILSEYPPKTKPARFHFPERNRLISALSFGTLIIEAKLKSGTMITADQALEQGRIVMVMPGDILNPNTAGCHALIQQGAKLVQNTQDIMEEWLENKHNWEMINQNCKE
ncbi:MAG: DNA-processing protein DprA [Bacillota bacterium]